MLELDSNSSKEEAELFKVKASEWQHTLFTFLHFSAILEIKINHTLGRLQAAGQDCRNKEKRVIKRENTLNK